MDKLTDCIDSALKIIHEAFNRAKRPVFYYSGGKDSTVLLNLLLFKYFDGPNFEDLFDVVFHREPFALHKFEFGISQLSKHGLTAFDWPPVYISMELKEKGLTFVNHQQIGRLPDGRIAVMAKPKNILEPPVLEFLNPSQIIQSVGNDLCTVDILKRPTAFFNYPWDMIIHGHKGKDVDFNYGRNPLADTFIPIETGACMAFPLYAWTDKEIWDYIEQEKLEIDLKRYDPFTRSERSDKTYNSEFFAACTNCVDIRKKGEKVFCPKIHQYIDNISETIDYRDTVPEYLIKEKAKLELTHV